MKIIKEKQLLKPDTKLVDIYKEIEALIAIIAKSIETAKRIKVPILEH